MFASLRFIVDSVEWPRGQSSPPAPIADMVQVIAFVLLNVGFVVSPP